MRLAAKLVLLFLIGVLLIVSLFSYLTIQLDQRLAIAEHQRHAAELADAVQQSPTQQSNLWRNELRIRESRIRFVQFNSGNSRYRPAVPAEMIVLSREVTTVRMPDEFGGDRLYTYLRTNDSSSDPNSEELLEISSPDPGGGERLRRSLMSSLIALVGVATLSGLVIVVGGVKLVGKPLNQLIDKVHRVGQGDFSQPVQLRSGDELGKLGSAINEMCDQLIHQREELEGETASRIEAVAQLRHAERLNMVGRMAAGIAHEIGTPLNVVSGRAELIASGMLSEDAVRESAQAIQSESQRITKTVRHLLDFARRSAPQRSRQNLNQLISVTSGLMEPLAARHHTELHLDLPDETIFSDIDPSQIQQVLTNLVVNAIQTTDEKGRVKIGLKSVQMTTPGNSNDRPQEFCRIDVVDNGGGISEEDRQRIFEPFFTTKDVGEGTGLGLSISHGIVQEHDGWITVDSEPNQGSTFSVFLPASKQDPSHPQHEESTS